MYRNWSGSVLALIPELLPGNATRTSTGPGLYAFGEMAVISVGDMNVTFAAGFPPNRTLIFEEKLVPFPLISTEVPPDIEPLAGLMSTIVGIGTSPVVNAQE